MKKQPLLILILFLLLVSVAFFYYYQAKLNHQQKEESLLSNNEALLVLDYGNKKQRFFKGDVVRGMTVSDAISAASMAGNFNFKTDSGIDEIDGLKNSQKAEWQCYLNNIKIGKKIRRIKISPRDKILCRYIKRSRGI